MTVAEHTTSAPLLRLEGITKTFGGVVALRGVDFDLLPGEVHALLGENGAGKSTLIRILAGIHRPDSGGVLFDEHPVEIRSVADADELGVRVIHQELALAPNMTVADNIWLGREPVRRWGIDRQRMVREARELVVRLGLDEIADVTQPVRELSVAHRQLVEIARALATDARVLVLDEPTSSLSEVETDALFATLSRLRTRGVGIIYISHRLDEIARIADRVTVLRDGADVGSQSAAELDTRQLVRWMVGRDVAGRVRDVRMAGEAGTAEVVLRIEGLVNDRVHDVSLTLHAGEVLGLAGLVGSGRTELARAVAGIDPVDAGRIVVGDLKLAGGNPGAAISAGLVLVPEDRQRDGLVMLSSVGFNIALPWTRLWNPDVRPNRQARQAIIGRAFERLGIRAASGEAGMATLSGGNQQKALVGRWLERPPKALILDEPTRGVDVGAREDMFRLIAELVADGMGVLLISSDLAEILSLSDRIATYRDGRILSVMPVEEASMESIMAQLTGETGR